MVENTQKRESKTILVVDDQIDNVLLVTRYLSTQGYATESAAGGEEALAKIATEPPDLILLDVVMPDMSGFEVCKRLKDNAKTMLIPVILVTTLDSNKDRINGLSAGADEFLSKPVNAEELMVRVRSLLRLQNARAAIEEQRLAMLKSRLSAHVSPELAQAFLSESTDSGIALQNRESRIGAVIMSIGLGQFEKIAERLSPDSVVAILNEYFSSLTDTVYGYAGTIFNMWGGNLLVGFGVPIAQEDSAIRALQCAKAMQKEFLKRCAHWPQRFGIQPSLHVGISYGEVVVGNVGSATYMRYTVIGDTVNHAGRLSNFAKRNEIILSERLAMRAGEMTNGIVLDRIPEVQVPGGSQSENLYRVSSKSA